LINSVQFAALSQPAFINIMAGSFSAHVRRVTVALFVLQLALLPMMAIASDANPEQTSVSPIATTPPSLTVWSARTLPL
jgi:hypothetical protein